MPHLQPGDGMRRQRPPVDLKYEPVLAAAPWSDRWAGDVPVDIFSHWNEHARRLLSGRFPAVVMGSTWPELARRSPTPRLLIHGPARAQLSILADTRPGRSFPNVATTATVLCDHLARETRRLLADAPPAEWPLGLIFETVGRAMDAFALSEEGGDKKMLPFVYLLVDPCPAMPPYHTWGPVGTRWPVVKVFREGSDNAIQVLAWAAIVPRSVTDSYGLWWIAPLCAALCDDRPLRGAHLVRDPRPELAPLVQNSELAQRGRRWWRCVCDALSDMGPCVPSREWGKLFTLRTARSPFHCPCLPEDAPAPMLIEVFAHNTMSAFAEWWSLQTGAAGARARAIDATDPFVFLTVLQDHMLRDVSPDDLMQLFADHTDE
jgi:hypothetical protein